MIDAIEVMGVQKASTEFQQLYDSASKLAAALK
jgi:hypothetical protein